MGDLDQPTNGYDHTDVEFLLRNKGLDISADLASSLKNLEDDLQQGVTSVQDALDQCFQFTRRTGAIVTSKFSILEHRIRVLESRGDSG